MAFRTYFLGDLGIGACGYDMMIHDLPDHRLFQGDTKNDPPEPLQIVRSYSCRLDIVLRAEAHSVIDHGEDDVQRLRNWASVAFTDIQIADSD